MDSQEEALCIEIVGGSGDLGGTLSYCGEPADRFIHNVGDGSGFPRHPFKPAPLPSPASTPAPLEEAQ